MVTVERTTDLLPHVGTLLGRSEWIVVTQEMIDRFADATGDRQWIHVDTQRAAREMPGGRTVAHGYLALSLLPRLGAGILRITRQSRALNYGVNRVRFLSPVPSGAQVRAAQTLAALEPVPGGARLVLAWSMEIAGTEKPALAAETIRLSFD